MRSLGLPALVAGAMLVALPVMAAPAATAAAALPPRDSIEYQTVFIQGGDRVEFSSQSLPVPLPPIGSTIEIYDKGVTLAGEIRSVKSNYRRMRLANGGERRIFVNEVYLK